ncbi:MAG: hypothetical protein PHX04_02715 [Bacilli bacterium]|nr:hypothetical protein [Bacilli bacterium]
MNIIKLIKNHQTKPINKNVQSSIFLDLADIIIAEFPYTLKNKTYLLIPNPKQELLEMQYEYRLYHGKIMPIAMTINILNIINKFTDVAKKLGFTIITEMGEYKNDGEIFNLLGNDANEKNLTEEEIINSNDINIPVTLNVDDYLKNIFLPAVFKNITANRGEDKYLIETKEQLNKIISLFNLPESKELNLKSEFVVQEYIKSFEGINSSIRIYTSCTGDILSALFLVSTDTKQKKRIKKYGIDIFNPCEYLNDPNSPYYLNSKNFISNAAAGGKAIPLNNELNNITFDDKILLTLHEIDAESLKLPDKLIEMCKKIANAWKSEKGIILGIDFIYNSQNDNWYYLETNKNPSVEGYKRYMNLDGYLKKDIKALMQLDSLIKIVENIMTKSYNAPKERINKK